MQQKTMEYKAVIFDLDGTLLDTLDDLKDSVNYVLRSLDYPERTREEIRHFVGNGIGMLMKRAVPEELNESDQASVLDSFREYYTAHCECKTKPYPGVISLLQVLKERNVMTAIVSNKNDAAVKRLSQQYFERYIDVAIGERQGIRRKPAPDTVNDVLKELKLTKDQVLYVGDSEVDYETAKNAGLDCVLVDWGFRDPEILMELHPMRVVHETNEILEVLHMK